VETAVLDATDFRIINLLRENGRASFSQLGDEVGLSPHGAADRVRRLERSGVITGFTITVAQDGIGRSLDAFVDVRLQSKTTPEAFERTVSALPAVRELAFVTGRFDYHVRVACRDADDLDQTVRAIRREGGAAQTETRIVLKSSTPMHPLS
jgi:Lrp/AsnC family transcriptional regulator, leucine-responsive regulatory protein